MKQLKSTNQYARDLEESILRITGGHRDKVDLFIGTVKSVDTDALTCVVTCESGEASVDLENVSLTAAPNDGFILFPSVESTVMVVASKFITPYILFYSNIDLFTAVAANGYKFGKATSPGVLGDKNAQALKDLAGKVDAIFNAIFSAVPFTSTSDGARVRPSHTKKSQ